MRPALLVAFALLLTGCPTPTQYGGPIAVDTEGFAVRMQWLCRWGMEGAKASACLGEPSQEIKAEEQADGGELPTTPSEATTEATGVLTEVDGGDWQSQDAQAEQAAP